jgi:hypothetical protein
MAVDVITGIEWHGFVPIPLLLELLRASALLSLIDD